jgi:hypothetical protein
MGLITTIRFRPGTRAVLVVVRGVNHGLAGLPEGGTALGLLAYLELSSAISARAASTSSALVCA